MCIYIYFFTKSLMYIWSQPTNTIKKGTITKTLYYPLLKSHFFQQIQLWIEEYSSYALITFNSLTFAINFTSRLYFFFFLRDAEMVYHSDHDYGKVQVSYSSFDLISFLVNFSFNVEVKATPTSNTHQSLRVILNPRLWFKLSAEN